MSRELFDRVDTLLSRSSYLTSQCKSSFLSTHISETLKPQDLDDQPVKTGEKISLIVSTSHEHESLHKASPPIHSEIDQCPAESVQNANSMESAVFDDSPKFDHIKLKNPIHLLSTTTSDRKRLVFSKLPPAYPQTSSPPEKPTKNTISRITEPPLGISESKLSKRSMCDCCGARDCSVYCQNCQGYFCSHCDLKYHPSTNPLMSRHVRVKSYLYVPPLFCPDHPSYCFSMFCEDCQEPCCIMCGIYSHKNHSLRTLREAFPILQEKAEVMQEKIQQTEKDITRSFHSVCSFLQDVKDGTEAVVDAIQESFSEIRDKLKRKEDQLMEQARLFQREQARMLEQKRDELRVISGDMTIISAKLREYSTEMTTIFESKEMAGIFDAKMCKFIQNIQEERKKMKDLLLMNVGDESKSEEGDDDDEIPLESSLLARISRESKTLQQWLLQFQKPKKCYLDLDSITRHLEEMEGLSLIIGDLEVKKE
ncbi:hypothetical protein ADUPG1_011497 [Aduncisulcus paluster]|uniref:B box-type domain-containing protein n=1 Tax=Aduncisulcus paluster TaxID=2918883 RepID=A0ABQ5K092_9EUKA|nr:hypothetical protein ADUPG1_011497 [Aduncisulcus paluster]